jgi:hypothetical protein
MFQSAADKTVLAMTASGFQRSDAGPNYSPSSNDVVYQFHIDNNDDAREDLTFQFLFGHKFVNGTGASVTVGGLEVPIALVAFGQIKFVSNPETLNQENLNNLEYYSVRLLSGDKYDNNIDDGPFLSLMNDESHTRFVKPVDNVGNKAFGGALFSLTAYEDYVEHFVYNQVHIPGCGKAAKMFVGPRREPFSINLGGIFDLFGVEDSMIEERIAVDHNVPQDAIQNTRFNSLDCNTVVAFVLEVATECLLAKTQPRRHTIQGFASVRKLEHTGAGGAFHRAGEQINRVGHPLVSELLIGAGSKDNWAKSHPKDDEAAFQQFYLFPTVPKAIALKFGLSEPFNGAARQDLIVLLKGIAGVTDSGVFADMVRLNTKVPPVATELQSSLGMLDADFAGYPNGRRFGDDVVDVTLRGLMGAMCTTRFKDVICNASPVVGVNTTTTCNRLAAVCVFPVNNTEASLHYTDRSPISAEGFMDHFPFLNAPVQGNTYIDCWRSHNVNAQFRTFANCATNDIRRGCNAQSTDPSCTCIPLATPSPPSAPIAPMP